ncbi:helix-turn-helix domain-containing protein [Streptomyces sp. NPDC005181]|uniref:helix-turn-helix domain-containing protein n=1 Tax=Streptomyces sp. NPDC005181 TaxID=3156869 RepID=UPI0033BB865C
MAFLTVQDAAKYMGISVNTLYVWRHRWQGPPSFRMGDVGQMAVHLVDQTWSA